MENEMQNRTENSPLIPPVKQGRSPDYAAGLEGFRSEISKAGLSIPNELIADERIHRFASNGKPSDNAGWYILFPDGIAAGTFGCWREDFKINWCFCALCPNMIGLVSCFSPVPLFLLFS